MTANTPFGSCRPRPMLDAMLVRIPPLERSLSTAAATLGCCTFTATARPSWRRARCTCPMEALAMGTSLHWAKSSSGGAPSSATMSARTSAGDDCGVAARSPFMASS